MSTLCETMDTLAMVYVDEELDAAERRELELHLHDCPSCRDHVTAERQSRVALRAMLAPPPAPTLLRARIDRGLADEDREVTRASRRGTLGRWALPGVASLAAAAALVFFVIAPAEPAERTGGEVARAAVKAQANPRLSQVKGPSTGPWLQENFQPGVPMPAFDDSSVRVVGARLVKVKGYDAAQIFYEVVAGPARLELSAFVLKNVRPGELRGASKVVVDGNALYVSEMDGDTGRTSIVSFEDADQTGYVFMSRALGAQGLLDVVVGSDLIRRSHDRIR